MTKNLNEIVIVEIEVAHSSSGIIMMRKRKEKKTIKYLVEYK